MRSRKKGEIRRDLPWSIPLDMGLLTLFIFSVISVDDTSCKLSEKPSY